MAEEYIVVGAGVVGSSTALALKRRGYNVKLLEQFFVGHTRGSSHGPSRIIRNLYEHERYTQFMPNAYKLWKQLEEEENIKLYTKCGIMNISATERVPTFTEILEKNNCGFTVYGSTDAAAQFPIQFREEESAVVEHEAGVLDASNCVRSIINQFQKLGGEFITGVKIKSIEHVNSRVTLVAANELKFSADRVVLACGSWMKNMLLQLDLDLPLTPIRVDVPYWEVKKSHWGLYDIENFPAGIYDQEDDSGDSVHYYWTPVKEYDNLIKIAHHGSSGGCINPDARDDLSIQNQEAYMKLLNDQKRKIAKMFPGVKTDNGPAINETCIYTLTPDADFILDTHPKYKNLVIACGFSGHGFKMAPEVGETLADLASDKVPKYDMSHFSVKRFLS